MCFCFCCCCVWFVKIFAFVYSKNTACIFYHRHLHLLMRLVHFPFLPTASHLVSQRHYSSSLFRDKQGRRRPRWRTHHKFMARTTETVNPNNGCEKEKLVVIMGATGTGKSRLSIDLATQFFDPSEIVNSDKMQVYGGLDITTNKIPLHERCGVPHHFLGDFDPRHDGVEMTASEYRRLADGVISGVVLRGRTPLLVGGSNSFIYSLLVEDYDPGVDVFGDDSVSSTLRYNCCFLWVDSSLPVLFDYLDKRVDDMLDSGMFEELAQFFNSQNTKTTSTWKRKSNSSVSRVGLRKAIGVPEFERYFKMYPDPTQTLKLVKGEGCDGVRRGVYEEAVREIKENTCRLAERQIGKIMRLRRGGWDLRRLEATTAFQLLMKGDEEWRRVWEKQVVEPSVKIVKRFLDE